MHFLLCTDWKTTGTVLIIIAANSQSSIFLINRETYANKIELKNWSLLNLNLVYHYSDDEILHKYILLMFVVPPPYLTGRRNIIVVNNFSICSGHSTMSQTPTPHNVLWNKAISKSTLLYLMQQFTYIFICQLYFYHAWEKLLPFITDWV